MLLAPDRSTSDAMPGVVLGAVAALALGSAAWALMAPSPLSIKILGTRSTGQLQSLDEIDIRVTNRTGSIQRPHFTVNESEHATTFWYSIGTNGTEPVVAPRHRGVPATRSEHLVHAPDRCAALRRGVHGQPGHGVDELSLPRLIAVHAAHPRRGRPPGPGGSAVTLTVQLDNRYGSAVPRAEWRSPSAR